jgi:hypothetical protein
MTGALSNKRHVAALAASYAIHPRNVVLYLKRFPNALDHVDAMKAAIRNREVDLSGDPFHVLALAHAVALRKQRDLSKPGSLEMTMREELLHRKDNG